MKAEPISNKQRPIRIHFHLHNRGLLIRKKKDENGKLYRYIDQVCFYLREGGQNKIIMVVNDGKFIPEQIPEQLQKRFVRACIQNPFVCREVGE